MRHGCLQAVSNACRLTLTRVDVAVGVDSALLAARNYCERAAKELHAAGGRILPKDGRMPPTLQQQLEGLQAWHAFLATRLQVFKVPTLPHECRLLSTSTSMDQPAQPCICLDTFREAVSAKAGCLDLLCMEAVCGFDAAPSRGKEPPCSIDAVLSSAQSKFRKASAGVVAAADCNSVSVGMDSGQYEGPLRVRLPVQLSPKSSAEGAWSFVVPLPDPASQKLLSRSVSPAPLSKV